LATVAFIDLLDQFCFFFGGQFVRFLIFKGANLFSDFIAVHFCALFARFAFWPFHVLRALFLEIFLHYVHELFSGMLAAFSRGYSRVADGVHTGNKIRVGLDRGLEFRWKDNLTG
jgi:hypothetical protein